MEYVNWQACSQDLSSDGPQHFFYGGQWTGLTDSDVVQLLGPKLGNGARAPMAQRLLSEPSRLGLIYPCLPSLCFSWRRQTDVKIFEAL